MRSNRYRPILVILIVVAAAFILLRLIGVGGLNEANFETQRTSPLQIQHAIKQTTCPAW